mmetsp:Transcript_23703/g.49035  ORF Transcript_23703/g.49035 Transcript_23703/m.49035 type:complete len:430 (-) Transcript_23703:37-1326(-)|eukprot:CAMPEP_0178575248 /NCGR_PEP_ID=MMETSP0697-20121206/19797_1 /TAXON_ID=265572 /ORGANISM="Extubocellulus spinifer, Strain CCMP396" /LENGTH=429 /DNA_ID=CAMNT_0020210315 /DNA_START=73 /DNA_END=1362 /DNA_ORIENTATION=+
MAGWRWRRSLLLKFLAALLSLQALTIPLAFLIRRGVHDYLSVTSRTSLVVDELYRQTSSKTYHSSSGSVYDNDTAFAPSPSKILRSTSSTDRSLVLPSPPVTIYLEYAWNDLHGEIVYSIIREFCGSFAKDRMFVCDAIPTFYLGPVQRISYQTIEIWKEFNITSTCGPVHIGTPDNPDLTVLTTTYNNRETYTQEFIAKHVNNSRFLVILHDDSPEMEYATNIFWLTPLHRRYFIPNYFPPTFVSLKRTRKESSHVPVFLVLGKATKRKRNIFSLVPILKRYQHEDFVIRIMGKLFPPLFNQSMHCTQPWCKKVEYVQLPDALNFMKNVTEADAILPLVDETNFYSTYQGGKKLSSSVMWAQGFGLRLVLYRELAYLYNVRDGFIYDEHPTRTNMAPGEAHWRIQSGRRRSFIDAFGECLRQIKADQL